MTKLETVGLRLRHCRGGRSAIPAAYRDTRSSKPVQSPGVMSRTPDRGHEEGVTRREHQRCRPRVGHGCTRGLGIHQTDAELILLRPQHAIGVEPAFRVGSRNMLAQCLLSTAVTTPLASSDPATAPSEEPAPRRSRTRARSPTRIAPGRRQGSFELHSAPRSRHSCWHRPIP